MVSDSNPERHRPLPLIGPGSPTSFWGSQAIPSATLIIARERQTQRDQRIRGHEVHPHEGSDLGGKSTSSDLEILMVKRDAGLAFAGGMWVFPGGRIDTTDLPDLKPDQEPESDIADLPGNVLEIAAETAAIRETIEETGLAVPPDSMTRWSHWTAPPETPRRFTTAFFIAQVGADHERVVIDNGEIREFRWLAADDVLSGHAAGDLALTPPTYITLTQLTRVRTVQELDRIVATRTVEHFATRFGFIGENMIAMYHGDAGYDSNDVLAVGRRHRLTLGSKGTPWSYLRDP